MFNLIDVIQVILFVLCILGITALVTIKIGFMGMIIIPAVVCATFGSSEQPTEENLRSDQVACDATIN